MAKQIIEDKKKEETIVESLLSLQDFLDILECSASEKHYIVCKSRLLNSDTIKSKLSKQDWEKQLGLKN